MRVIFTFGRCDICDRCSPLSWQNRWQLPLSVLGSIIATAFQCGSGSGTASCTALQSIVHQTSATALRQQLHWLPIRQRITYKLATLTFKAKYCRPPLYLHEQLRDHQVARALRSTTAPLFYRPCVHRLRLSGVLLLCTSSLELSRDIHKIGEHFQ